MKNNIINILLVEDEKNFASVLKEYLKMNDYDVDLCENGEEGIQAFKLKKYDLCLLDIMMPKKDGFSLSSEIRILNKHIPIIFLTARGMREDMIRGYKAGGDDYIVKPFDSEILLLKIKAILGRRENSLADIEESYQLGQIHFNVGLRLLKLENGSEIKLSPKECDLLSLLCQHKDHVLLRETALNQIWKEDTYFTKRSMDVYITKLRKYLSLDPSIEIVNLHGNGYALKIGK